MISDELKYMSSFSLRQGWNVLTINNQVGISKQSENVANFREEVLTTLNAEHYTASKEHITSLQNGTLNNFVELIRKCTKCSALGSSSVVFSKQVSIVGQ